MSAASATTRSCSSCGSNEVAFMCKRCMSSAWCSTECHAKDAASGTSDCAMMICTGSRKKKASAKNRERIRETRLIKVADAESDPSTIYGRVGGSFAIAALVKHFSDAILADPAVGLGCPNKRLREWGEKPNLDRRYSGLKSQRWLWMCQVTGGPQIYVPTKPGKCPLSLENAHFALHISSAEFDIVARILRDSLNAFNVPQSDAEAILGVFASHKHEVTMGHVVEVLGQEPAPIVCPHGEH